MKRVYRYEENKDYWDRRWNEAGSDARTFQDLTIYPILYAEKILQNNQGSIAEIGCGLGRLVKHYDAKGYNIIGIERSLVASLGIDRKRKYNIVAADVCDLPFQKRSFDNILAFGLFHNIEKNYEDAIEEAASILKKKGKFCISIRPDNLEMRINELYWKFKNKSGKKTTKGFHKILFTENEFIMMLKKRNLKVTKSYYARNVSNLYRIPFLRSNAKSDIESLKRARGYKLNKLGSLIDDFLMKKFPSFFCNVLVFVGYKE